MFTLHRRVCLILVAVCLTLSGCTSSRIENCINTGPHPGLVVFGDSYSDTGNIAIGNAINLPDPFDGGRFSNGLVLAEHLANHLGTNLEPSLHTIRCCDGYNYAVGGGNVVGTKRQDLGRQVDDYLRRVSQAANPSAVFFIMIGGNDIRQMNTSISAAQVDLELQTIADTLFNQVQRLIDAGAQTIIVANSGDMGKLPGSNDELDDNPTVLSSYSQQFNTMFNARISTLTLGSATVIPFNLYDAMDTIIRTLQTDPSKNTTQACIDLDIDFERLVDSGFGTSGPLPFVNGCSDAELDNFVFFDSVHATAATHQLLFNKLLPVLP